MKLAILIVSRNRPDLVDAMVASLATSVTVPYDLYVVECGTDLDKLSRHSTLWYADPDFAGKCYGHHVALQAALARGAYDYVWFLMNDLVFDAGVDPAQKLIGALEREPRMAILSPTNAEGGYPASEPRVGGGWRKVTTCDYLGFMMKGAAIEEVGFLNPAFRYCWGAIHELAFKLYSRGWFVAYSDDVSYRHLGGTTYGAKGTNTISREEYQRNARRFAFDYMREHYGVCWEKRFFAATHGHAIEIDTFAQHKRAWAEAFTAEELRDRETITVSVAGSAARGVHEGSLRLHLGCGGEYRDGWLNVDANPVVRADLHCSIESLPAIRDGSAQVVEACHVFEHLTLTQARAALCEWRRVLRGDGELLLELPDLEACIRILGQETDEGGIDLGMIGIYGWPPDIDRDGAPQMHKWGWTRTTLTEALRHAGFGQVTFEGITQTWRPAARVGRDMRVRASGAAAYARGSIDATDPPGSHARPPSSVQSEGSELRAPLPRSVRELATAENAHAEAAFGAGAFAAAAEHAMRACELDPSYAIAWNNLGVCLTHVGERHGACEAFEKALELAPGDETVLLNLRDVRATVES